MSRKHVVEGSLDFLEGRLAASESERFQDILDQDSESRELYEGFLGIIEEEKRFVERQYELSSEFDEQVMKELSARERNEPFIPIQILSVGEMIGGTIASCLSVFLLVFLYSHSGPSKSFPLGNDSAKRIASSKVLAAAVSPSFEVVDIPLEMGSQAGSLLRPDGRVDVLWEFQGEGRRKTTKIIQAAEIFSLDGDDGSKTAQLLLTSYEAKKAKLAVVTGRVSLSPANYVSDEGSSIWDAPTNNKNAIMFLRDPSSKQMVEYHLNGQTLRWEKRGR